MSAAEMVHARRMREEKGADNVCSREGTCKDRGRRGVQCLRQRGYM